MYNLSNFYLTTKTQSLSVCKFLAVHLEFGLKWIKVLNLQINSEILEINTVPKNNNLWSS
jgi:hypothetical protein